MDKYQKKVISFYREHKRMPSFRELASLFGFKSPNAAFKLAEKLLKVGFIKKDKSGKLIPGSFCSPLKILGTVQAGFPSPAEEELSDTMSMDEFLIRNKDATFLLKVQGDSMEGAGIFEGDLVLAEKGVTPKDGDIVIAEVDHEWTMKYFKKKSGKFCLEPANKKYKTIFPEEDLTIAAVVKAVVRKYF